MNKSITWGLGVILVLVVGLCALITPPQVVPGGEISQKHYQSGEYPVSVKPLLVVDKSRETSPNGRFAGVAHREFKGKVWYPALPKSDKNGELEKTSFPLVIYSHGFMSFHEEGAYIAKLLASHGYVVVAVDYPLTNYFAAGGPMLGDVVNQPGDVSFLIDTVLDEGSEYLGEVARYIDRQRIAAVGLSLGGMTTELVSFHGRLRDARIAAAVSIAGPASMFNESFFNTADVPFMMIAGDIDAIVNYQEHALPIRDKVQTGTLVTLRGASHAGFAGIASKLFRWINNPDSVGCYSIKHRIPQEEGAFLALGGEEYGVIFQDKTRPCEADKDLPKAMRPQQQHMLTALATYAFLESLFSTDAQRREDLGRFLYHEFARENPEVEVSTGLQG